MKEKSKRFAAGMAAGFINGLLGTGGGMLAVPMLTAAGASVKESHATSLAVILPIMLVSAVVYLLNGSADFSAALPFLPWGAAGAVLGAAALRRVDSVWLQKGFAALMILSALRLLLF